MPVLELFSTHLAAEVAVQVLGKGTLLLGLAWAAVALLRGATPSQRHGIWTAAFALALLLPALGSVLPTRELPLLAVPAGVLGIEPPPLVESPPPVEAGPPQAAEHRSAGPAAAGRPGEPGAGSSTLSAGESAGAGVAVGLPGIDGGVVAVGFLLLWVAGVIILTVRLLGHWIRIAVVTRCGTSTSPGDGVHELVRRESERLGLMRSVRVVYSTSLGAPATGGLLRPVLILPPDATAWPEARLRAVIVHELVHVRRWDLLTQQLAEIARIFYWANPLLWVAHRSASDDREHACDREVVRSGIPGHEYAGVLVEMARRCRAPSPALGGGLPMARPGSLLGRRVDAVLEKGPRKVPPRWAAVATGLLLAFASVPLASVEVLAVPSNSSSVAELTRALGSGSVEVRLQAVRNLAAWCWGESTRVLADVLQRDSEDERVRAAAATGLGRHARAGSLKALRTTAADADAPTRVRRAAVEAMGSLDGVGTIATLGALLDDDDAGIRWLALRNLGRLTRAPEQVRDALGHALLHDPEPRNRGTAAVLLHEMGCETAAPLLERAMRTEVSPEVRERIASLLGTAGPRHVSATGGHALGPNRG